MSGVRGSMPTERVVHSLVGDETVLCVAAQARGRIVIVINQRYARALAHMESHLARGIDGVQICSIECPGPDL